MCECVDVLRLTGEDFPTHASRPIVVNGPYASVFFASDSTQARSGFRLTFEGGTSSSSSSMHRRRLSTTISLSLTSISVRAVDCRSLNRCSGRGVCMRNMSEADRFYCACMRGWTGPNCTNIVAGEEPGTA
jgi:hypothetical protein